MKYLIVKCDELSDGWECDAYREPICMTDDYSKYGYGYEVYELQSDNTFKLIKDYDKINEEGIAVYDYTDDKLNKIFEKHKDLGRYEITKSQIKKWKSKYHFTETIEEILADLQCSGSYGEEINNKLIVIGEYKDDIYSWRY